MPNVTVFLATLCIITILGQQHATADGTFESAVMVVNQPKCGTGFLVGELYRALQCKKMEVVPTQTLTFDCRDNVLMLRSHSPEYSAAALSELFPERPAGKCHVVTAVRDPRIAIPSKFFESNKAMLCGGEQTKEEVVAQYEEHLSRHQQASRGLFETTTTLMKAFGATNITDEMDKVWANGGHSVISDAAPGSKWAGCELMVVEMAFSSSWGAALGDYVPGAEALKVPRAVERGHGSRKDMCPKAADNYDAIMNLKMTAEWLEELKETNQDAHEAIMFYAAHDPPPARD